MVSEAGLARLPSHDGGPPSNEKRWRPPFQGTQRGSRRPAAWEKRARFGMDVDRAGRRPHHRM